MTVTGDWRKLKKWISQIDKAGGDVALAGVTENLAEESLDLVQEGFRGAKDPSGRNWKPKKEKDGRAPLHGRTSRLRRGWHRQFANSRGFGIGNAVKYAGVHQNGSPGGQLIKPRTGRKALKFSIGGRTVFAKSVKRGKIDARPMVPSKGRLPSKWRRAFIDVAQDFYTTHFKK